MRRARVPTHGPLRSRTARAARTPRPAALAASLAALVLPAVVGGGCGLAGEPDPLARVPALLIEGPALLRLLARTEALTATPAARLSARLRARLAECSEVFGVLPEPAGASSVSAGSSLDALRCRRRPASGGRVDSVAPTRSPERLTAAPQLGDPLAAASEASLAERLERARGAHAGILQWPVGRAGRLELTVDVDADGGLALAGRLEPDDDLGPPGFLLPSATPPRPPLVDADHALFHLHLRSATGAGLAAWIPKESQGDRLFALKGRLLEGALLEGTLELALIEPAPGHEVPLAAVVLHHRAAAPIAAALDEALAQLQRTWSIEPSARRFATQDGVDLEGGCYADLPLLPELAPCWVVTDEALVLGYRAEAVEAVLARLSRHAASTETRTAGGQSDRPATRMVLDLERMRRLDRRLTARTNGAGVEPAAMSAAAAAGNGTPMRRPADLYGRLELEAVANGEAIALTGSLRARR